MDGLVLHAGQSPAAAPGRHRCNHLTRARHNRAVTDRGRLRGSCAAERALIAGRSPRCARARRGCCSSRASRGSASRICSPTSPARRGGGRHGARGARVRLRGRPALRAARRRARRPSGRAGPRRLARLGLADPAALAGALPRSRGRGRRRPTATAPSAHCATCSSASPRRARSSSASTTSTGPIPRPSACSPRSWPRRPAAPVLLALAARENQVPAPLAAALADALRDDAPSLRAGAAVAGRGGASSWATRAAAVDTQAGGNPFYLEQLARARRGPRAARAGRRRGRAAAVTAALATELAGLGPTRGACSSGRHRRGPVRAGAGRAGGRAARRGGARRARRAARRRARAAARAPRRFAFRHPVVRQAVYDALPGGWRLGAHARAADALAHRGAGAVERAHHVAHAARPRRRRRDRAAHAAAAELQAPAPAIAARFHAAALALLPDGRRSGRARARLQARLADAQAAGGDPEAARAHAGRRARAAPAGERLALTVAWPTRSGGSGITRMRAAACTSRSATSGRALARPRPARLALSLPRCWPATSTTPSTRRATRATTPAPSATPCSRSRRSPPARSPPSARPAGGRRRSAWPPPRPRSSGSTRASSRPGSRPSGCTGARAVLRAGSTRARRPRARRRARRRDRSRARLLVLTVERVPVADRAGPARRRDRRRAGRVERARPPATRACCCGR